MRSHATRSFWRALERLPAHVRRQAREAYRRFEQDPYHRSLHFKLVGGGQPIYSARIGLHYRALGIMEGEEIVWFWIGSHTEYDQILRGRG
jgi:mRNA-degrading endonuclease RelE of RelBE toxin-antitoxin system